MDHASPLVTVTADAAGQASHAPCLRPHLNCASIVPCMVTIVTFMFVMLSAAHSTNPCCGHPRRSRLAHWYSSVMRS